MNRIRTIVFAGLILSFTSPAFSQGKACLMEGSLTFGGKKTEMKDCLQNNGVPQAQFTETCSSLMQMGAEFGAALKITYMAACPSPSQGSCEGFFGQPITTYYYKRDAETLSGIKSSCQHPQVNRGKWK